MSPIRYSMKAYIVSRRPHILLFIAPYGKGLWAVLYRPPIESLWLASGLTNGLGGYLGRGYVDFSLESGQ